MKTLTILAAIAALCLSGSARAESYPAAVGARCVDAGKHLAGVPFTAVATPIAYAFDFERGGSHAMLGLVAGVFVAPFEMATHGLLFGWRAATFPIAIPGQDLGFKWYNFGTQPLTGGPTGPNTY